MIALIRVADYIMERLYSEGVKHVFMVTGRGSLFLTDAVAGHPELYGVSVHHEQAAAYAAIAYAECNEKVGACLVSTGCGGTNAVTGVLSAWQDGIPCVFVSGQNKLQETVRYSGIPIRTFGQQEADIVSIVEPITKYAVMIDDPKNIGHEMDKALYLAQSGRKGPVWIDVPLDIQNMRIDPQELKRFYQEDETNYEPAPEDIEYVKKELDNAKRPVILIGSGIRSAGAVLELQNFINKCPIPVTYACSATDVLDGDNKLSIGAVGSLGGTRAGNFTVQNADLVLVLGCRLSPMTTGSDYEKFAREAKVVVIDIDKVEHSKKTVKVDRLIISDIKKFLTALRRENIQQANDEWLEKCFHWKEIFPKCEDKYKTSKEVDLYYLAECLSKDLPENAVFLCDAGLEELILPSAINFQKEQRCVHPVSQGAMGFALPGTIGAYYASKHPIITVIGDGSIMMNLQELQTISSNNIPVKIIVVNNNCYSTIRQRQKELFRKRTIGTDPQDGVTCPDFEKVASCFGISYMKINESRELKDKLDILINSEGPVLCEVMGIENQEYLCSSYALNSNRRYVQRPLEDQAPFMDRDLFLAEMIIKPID